MSAVEGTSAPVTGCQSYSNTSLFQLQEYFVLWPLSECCFSAVLAKGKASKMAAGHTGSDIKAFVL